MKYAALLKFVFLLCFPANACFAQDQKSPTVVKIGIAAALSGGAAPWGQGEVQGAKLALEEFENSSASGVIKFESVVEDTAGSATKTASAVSKLLNLDNVKFIVGPTWLDSYQSAILMAEKKGALLITPSGAAEVIEPTPRQHPLIFSTWYELSPEIAALVTGLKERNLSKVLIVTDKDLYQQEVAHAFTAEASKQGMEVVDEAANDIAATDFRAVLTKARRQKPDIVLVLQTEAASYLSLLKQSKQLLPSTPIYGIHDLAAFEGNPVFHSALDGVRFCYPKLADADFTARYQKRYGESPAVSASTAYDATNILLETIAKGNTTPTTAAKYLSENTFRTVSYGEIRFNNRGGLSGAKFSIREFRNGKAVEVND